VLGFCPKGRQKKRDALTSSPRKHEGGSSGATSWIRYFCSRTGIFLRPVQHCRTENLGRKGRKAPVILKAKVQRENSATKGGKVGEKIGTKEKALGERRQT